MAERELNDAIQYFEHERSGLGAAFLAEVRLGSTLGDVQTHYQVILSREEGFRAVAEDIRMSFNLESDARTRTVHVTSVWLYEDPDAVRRARCPERRP